jgi:hypothetical protein
MRSDGGRSMGLRDDRMGEFAGFEAMTDMGIDLENE